MNHKHVNYFASGLNFSMALVFLCNAVDKWIVAAYLVGVYLLVPLVVIAIYQVLSAFALVALEFKGLKVLFEKDAPFLTRPFGRGIFYILLGISTVGPYWYQILSVILGLVFGLVLIGISFQAPTLQLNGLISGISDGPEQTEAVEKNTPAAPQEQHSAPEIIIAQPTPNS